MEKDTNVPSSLNLLFSNNHALVSGSNLFGGLLDRCSQSPFGKTGKSYQQNGLEILTTLKLALILSPLIQSGCAFANLIEMVNTRVDEGERVSNGAYINGEHHWESNVTLNAVHVIVVACACLS